MRIDSDVAVEFLSPQGNALQRDSYVQGESADVLERLTAEELAAVAALNTVVPLTSLWLSLFVDIAGAGDGHPFMFRVYSAALGPIDEVVSAVDNAVDPGLIRVFFWSAAQSEALDAAAVQAQQRLAAEVAALSELDSFEEFKIRQTGLAGGSQGTQVCGFMLGVIQPVPVTLASAVLGGGGELTITGTGLQSELPNTQTILNLLGAGVDPPTGARLLTQQQILDAGGTISPTEIVVPASLVSGLGVGDSVIVSANGINNEATVGVT